MVRGRMKLDPARHMPALWISVLFWARSNLLYTLLYMPATRTQIYLTAEQRKKLDARRKRERKSLAAVVREAIDAYLSPGEADFRKIVRRRSAAFRISRFPHA